MGEWILIEKTVAMLFRLFVREEMGVRRFVICNDFFFFEG